MLPTQIELHASTYATTSVHVTLLLGSKPMSMAWAGQVNRSDLTCKTPKTTITEFANTADPDERAHNEPSHQDLQCLPSI